MPESPSPDVAIDAATAERPAPPPAFIREAMAPPDAGPAVPDGDEASQEPGAAAVDAFAEAVRPRRLLGRRNRT
jgi:hypothetical protein